MFLWSMTPASAPSSSNPCPRPRRYAASVALYRTRLVRRVNEAADRLGGLSDKCRHDKECHRALRKPFSRCPLYTLLSNPIYTHAT